MTNQTDTFKIREIVKRLEHLGMRCNCDLDNWQPEASSGHSHVCRIHKAAWSELLNKPNTAEAMNG